MKFIKNWGIFAKKLNTTNYFIKLYHQQEKKIFFFMLHCYYNLNKTEIVADLKIKSFFYSLTLINVKIAVLKKLKILILLQINDKLNITHHND